MGYQETLHVNFIQRIEFAFNIINHVFIGFVSIFLTYVCFRDGLSGSAVHGLICTIGYNLLMAEAIMCHYSGNVLMLLTTRKTKTTIHWVLMAIGGGLGIAGAIYKIIERDGRGKKHFKSAHGILGLIATILSFLACVSGTSALYSKELQHKFSPIFNKTLHVILGYIGFFIGMLTMYYGYETGFFSKSAPLDMADLLKALTLTSLILSSIGPLKSIVDKLKTIFG